MATDSSVPVSPSGYNIDAYQITNAAGQSVYRQVVVLGDPNNLGNVLTVDWNNNVKVSEENTINQELLLKIFTMLQVIAQYLYDMPINNGLALQNLQTPMSAFDEPMAQFSSLLSNLNSTGEPVG